MATKRQVFYSFHYKPDCFIKGGDRSEETMPIDELETCKRLGIEIIYGVGDLLNSSRGLYEET